MKTKLLYPGIILLLSISLLSFGQQETVYDIEQAAPNILPNERVESASATYWLGYTWLFVWTKNTEGYQNYYLKAEILQIDYDGHITGPDNFRKNERCW